MYGWKRLRAAWSWPLFVFVAACVNPPDEDLPRIQLQVQPTGLAYHNDTMTIRAVMENTSDRDFEYRHGSCQEPVVTIHGSGIQGGRSRLLGPEGPVGCPAAIVEARLRPGERLEANYVWNGTTNPANPPSARAPVGEYLIVATFNWETGPAWNATSQTKVWVLN